MSLNRYAKRRDANEGLIVEALRQVGAVVVTLDTPVDLLVGHGGVWRLLEVKRPTGAVRASQWGFIHDCQDKNLPAYIVRTVEDALQAIGCIH